MPLFYYRFMLMRLLPFTPLIIYMLYGTAT